MDLYEYQARDLLEEQGIETPKAIFVRNIQDVAQAAETIGFPVVIRHRSRSATAVRPVASRSRTTVTKQSRRHSRSCP